MWYHVYSIECHRTATVATTQNARTGEERRCSRLRQFSQPVVPFNTVAILLKVVRMLLQQLACDAHPF